VRFQYGWLRQDLAQVVTGITEHLEAPLGAPRQFPPLKGDYRR
jgi:RAQPRD family integrative conjugative element protein